MLTVCIKDSPKQIFCSQKGCKKVRRCVYVCRHLAAFMNRSCVFIFFVSRRPTVMIYIWWQRHDGCTGVGFLSFQRPWLASFTQYPGANVARKKNDSSFLAKFKKRHLTNYDWQSSKALKIETKRYIRTKINHRALSIQSTFPLKYTTS